MKIIECVANVSEGRDEDVLVGLQRAVADVPGVALLDVHTDPDHNRSVFTWVNVGSDAAAVAEAAFCLAAEAAARIDLTRHTGRHPRMGAVDVLPFVPIREATMAECAAMARQTAERIAAELHIPAFLYEYAATRDRCRNLADVRRGGFEGLAKKMQTAEWTPDFGPDRPHPTAGAVAVGARKPLIAFNVNLDTPDATVADAVARAVRGSSGGLPHCKALGVFLASRNLAQVSMNLTDYEQTPVLRVFEVVRREAARHGVGIVGSEIVGLVPERALPDDAAQCLRLEGCDAGLPLLETAVLRFGKRSIDKFAENVYTV